MKRYILITSIVIGILCIVGLLYYHTRHDKKIVQKPVKTAAPLPKEVTITLDKSGYTPKTVTIHTGTAVHWKNISGDKESVNSDNYPTNQLHKELNFGIFANNASVTYLFKVPGIYGYHNQFHPDEKGSIIVVQ